MKNKMLKKGLAIGMSAFLLASSLAPVSVQAASWKQNKTGWWWQEDNGSYPVSQWKVINGKWYAFDERGYMRSGWFLSNGKWYYLGTANDGSMKTGWQLINGSWYYLNPVNGDMAANQWIGIYYVNGSGVWDQGKTKDLIGWIQSGNRWWYRHADGGYTRNNWELINGSWYYFDNAGWMLSNQWIGDYYVDGSGKWIPGKTKATAQWIQSGNRWWYRHADGGYTRNGWELINGSWYYFDNAGWMLSNQWIGNYYVGGSGAMLTDTWIGDYYVDGSGKWDPSKQHEHDWQPVTATVNHPAETHQELVKEAWDETIHHDDEYKTVVDKEAWDEVIHHDAETKKELVKEAWDETIHHDEETKTIVDKEAWTETINHPAETHEELVKEAWTETVHHPAETHQELVKEAWVEEIPHEEEGHYEATVPGHWDYELVPAEGYEEEYETLDGGTDKRFVVTKHAYTKSTWVEPKTVECNEIGYEVVTPMYREEHRIICGGCGLDITDDYKEGSTHDHLKEEAMKGNDNCASSYDDYRMVQYDTRNVMYPATYVVDKEAWTETVQHDAEYKTVVDKEAWTETVHHDAEYKTVVDKEAWVETIDHPAETHEETIPAYDETVHHDAEYKTVVIKEAYDETIHHDAETHEELVKKAYDEVIHHKAEYKTVVDKEAWVETVVTGYQCSCGATK